MSKKQKKKRSTRIGELIAKWSKNDPEFVKRLEEGRKWVKDTFYAQVNEQSRNP